VEFVLKRAATFIDGLSSLACAGGVSTLDEEIFDDAMEDGVVVVAFETELDEVSDCFGSFFGPEFYV
jgi:hypothetical protein